MQVSTGEQLSKSLSFGLFVSLVGFVALLWPLIVSLIFPNATGVLWIYGIAFIVDILLLAVWVLMAVGYSKQAARGKMFEIARLATWTRRLAGNQ